MAATGGKPRVLLADDHVILLEGLRALLEAEFEIVGAVTDGRALLEEAKRIQPDAVVVDISMPLLNGLEAARQLRRTTPDSKIVILTMHSDPEFLLEAIRAGVGAYVVKMSAGSELNRAVRSALGGQLYVAECLQNAYAEIRRSRRDHRNVAPNLLSRRQREILQLLAEGHSMKDVSWFMGIAEKTAEYHKYKLMEKLGLKTVAELTTYAIKHKVVSLE